MLEVTEFKPSSAAFGQKRIAVLLPCYNEAVTIAKVVADFQMSLPGAAVYVYDNNSSDGTGAIARAAGACTLRNTRPPSPSGSAMRSRHSSTRARAVVVPA